MITEDFLKKSFSEFGLIVNVSMEIEKGRGFVTFSKTEATDRAIVEVIFNYFYSAILHKLNLNYFRCTEKPSTAFS